MSRATLCRVIATTLLVLMVASATGSAQCMPKESQLDTTRVSTVGSMWLGQAIGQTFLASDTLVRAITVWRIAGQDTNLFGIRVMIARTDSLGRPTTDVLFSGQTLVVPYGDGLHHTPFRFEFDPPVVLPSRGLYEMIFQTVPCHGYSDLIAARPSVDPNGSYWQHGRNGACEPRPNPREFADVDVLHRIEYCDTSTASRVSTWGQVKSRYR